MVENTCDVDHLPLLLPQDVLIQILVLLPVISLLRFKSVCKSWRALIQTPFFIDLHLSKKNNNNDSFGTFIYQTCTCFGYPKKKECQAFMLSSGSGSGSGGGGGEKLKWEDLGFPPCYRVHENIGSQRILMVGSCNGLICIVDPKQRDVSLWNPATRQFRLLPKSLTLVGIRDVEDFVSEYEERALTGAGIPEVEDFVAFGYDVKTKDYKVVQISWLGPGYRKGDIHVSEFTFRVQVYSLSRDSWRLLEGINSFPGFPLQGGAGRNHGVYRNGIYYFLAGYGGSEIILAFDFTKEIFTTPIQLPHDYYDYYIIPDLTYLGEKLALFAMVRSRDVAKSGFDDYDIWVLKEESSSSSSSSSSWTKIHSFQLNNVRTREIPKSISNDGEFALIATIVVDGSAEVNVLQLFNLVAKEVKKEFRNALPVARADVYKQSLVSIYGGNGVQHPVG